MEEYQGEQRGYDDAKLKVIEAVLATMGIVIKDEFGIITMTKDGKKVATIDISNPLS